MAPVKRNDGAGAPSVGTHRDEYDVVLDERVERDGVAYRRVLVRTPWFTEPFDLAAAVYTALGEEPRAGGTIFVSEKVAIVAAGKTVPVTEVRVTRAARILSAFTRPRGGNLAQSIPERMQFVIDRIGWTRTLVACVAAALTRPLGVRGAFFLVAGSQARDLDGMHAPYEDTLLPPLTAREGRRMAEGMAARLGCPVAIVDINDFGGHVRAVSRGGLPAAHLLRALRDNPMGHEDQATPFGWVAKL